MAFRDEARFYSIDGQQYPSVTTILQILNKPALGPWYAKMERQAFETAVLGVLSRQEPGALGNAEALLSAIVQELPRIKAADKEKTTAASIGTAAHALIEWHTRKMMGQDPGPELIVPDAALWAVEIWKEWAASVEFTPLHIEQVVHCPECQYAGTVDFIAKVNGVVTLGDYKTGKAIYPEAFLQVNAYRHAADRCGMFTKQGVIIRLPKVVEDPKPEVMFVPNEECEVPEAFRAAITLWRWKRTMEGKPTGTARG